VTTATEQAGSIGTFMVAAPRKEYGQCFDGDNFCSSCGLALSSLSSMSFSAILRSNVEGIPCRFLVEECRI